MAKNAGAPACCARPSLRSRFMLIRRAARDPRVHEADLKTLIVLVDSIGDSGRGWWGFCRIAKEVDKDRTTVIRSINRLEDYGYIVRDRTKGGSSGNAYGMPTTSGTSTTGSTDATGSVRASDRWHPRTQPVAPTHPKSLKSFPAESKSTPIAGAKGESHQASKPETGARSQRPRSVSEVIAAETALAEMAQKFGKSK